MVSKSGGFGGVISKAIGSLISSLIFSTVSFLPTSVGEGNGGSTVEPIGGGTGDALECWLGAPKWVKFSKKPSKSE
jgi:hypothetical protein